MAFLSPARYAFGSPRAHTQKETIVSVWALLLAAGGGSRLAKAGLPVKKQFLEVDGVPLFWLSARTFARIPAVAGLVFVFPPDEAEEMAARVETLLAGEDLGVACLTAAGGALRQDSARNGLAALPSDCDRVLVHDAARPFVGARVIQNVLAALDAGKKAVIPGIPVKDTIKILENGRVAGAPPRESLTAVQTPQGFEKSLLLRAFDAAREQGLAVTDDAGLVEALGEAVHVVEGSEDNVKITTPADLKFLAPQAGAVEETLTGFGYDVHRYADPKDPDNPKRRPMKLGGMPIPGGPDILAHSDGDVLLHALTDAILGVLAKGDIGAFFPDNDPAYEGMESGILLSEILLLLPQAGMRIRHVDLTVIAQIPKLAPHREGIKKSVAGLLGLTKDNVGFKATTEEGLGFTGEKKGIKAVAVVTVARRMRKSPEMI